MKIELPKETVQSLAEKMKDDYGSKNISIITFTELWGSSATGYSGMVGLDVLVVADTLILHIPEGPVRVYLGYDRLAYEIENPNDVFWADVKGEKMKPVSEAYLYETK